LASRVGGVFTDIKRLTEADLEKMIYIRNQGHTVMEAINRQLAHYPYHIGQIVYIGKLSATHWESLSIPRGNSQQFNADKICQTKRQKYILRMRCYSQRSIKMHDIFIR
jgi:hypothetical protein